MYRPATRIPRPSLRRPAHVGLLCIFGALLAMPALAQAPRGGVQAGAAAGQAQLLSRTEEISLDEAVRRVREQSGGRVLRAETRRENGRTVHRIRVLSPDGRVRTWTVDAETGRIS